MIVNINIVNDGEEGVVCFSCGCCWRYHYVLQLFFSCESFILFV